MPTDQNPRTERLIAEPLSVRLDIDRTSPQAAGSTAVVAMPNAQDAPLPLEAKRIVDALQEICALPDKAVVSWCGRPHQILKPHYANAEKGTQLIGRPGAERAAQIIKRGLARNRARIAFPWRMYALVRLLAALPQDLTDRFVNRLPRKP